MAVRLPWLDYLLIDIEKDSYLKKFYPFFKVVIEQARNKEITAQQAAGQLQAIVPSILSGTDKELYRITNLLEAVVSYTKKID